MATIIHAAIEWTAVGVEVVAVVLIAAAVVRVAISQGTIRYLWKLPLPGAYESYKYALIKPLLLSLDFLVAADVIRTVALDLTLASVAALGLLVLVRTFLSWSLAMEVGGPPPWRVKPHNKSADVGQPLPARESVLDGARPDRE